MRLFFAILLTMVVAGAAEAADSDAAIVTEWIVTGSRIDPIETRLVSVFQVYAKDPALQNLDPRVHVAVSMRALKALGTTTDSCRTALLAYRDSVRTAPSIGACNDAAAALERISEASEKALAIIDKSKDFGDIARHSEELARPFDLLKNTEFPTRRPSPLVVAAAERLRRQNP